ncbi:hypothetical protein OIU84_026809 [Salix udensis]|uniref:DYW domain-containing protein n=1 Tax=Salix udensis TaxID=889485 RepID=A0AAD6PDB1_9ROSI|nr:hypothetical protein OIU84_026809 [Salix udensis]
MELGGYAAELIFELDSHYPWNRVLLYNVYALAGRWNGAAEVRKTGREAKLKYRSENLALAFALLIASPGSTIRISKNIRVCGDCHSAFKSVPKMGKGKSRSEIPIGFIIFVMVLVHVGTTGSAGYQGITKWLHKWTVITPLVEKIGEFTYRKHNKGICKKKLTETKEDQERAARESAERDQERLSSTGCSQIQVQKQ